MAKSLREEIMRIMSKKYGHSSSATADSIIALIKEKVDVIDPLKINRGNDLYSGKPAPYSEGYRDGMNHAKNFFRAILDEADNG